VILLVMLYGVLALIRELCAVKYYGSVFNGRALSASALGLVIGLLDSFVFIVVLGKIAMGGGWIEALPLGVYELGAAAGTYLGVKQRRKR
jgi:hypothetical protein